MVRKRLRRLDNKNFIDDVKTYIKTTHDFFGIKVPELRVLAKRLHKEHSLKDFYKVFNKLWKSGYHEQTSLAIYTLELYKDDFDNETWEFLKPKLKDIKSLDQADSIASEIIGEIVKKQPALKKEIFLMSKSNNVWIRRMAIVSTLPLIKDGDVGLTLKIAENYVKENHDYIQKSTGRMLREVGKYKPDSLKKFIKKYESQMPALMFDLATEYMEELRVVNTVNRKRKRGISGLFFGWS